MILLPTDRLPESVAERHALLRDYFCDKDAAATLSREGWKLHLDWSGAPDRHVDPELDQGLAWWGKKIDRRDMALATRRSGRVLRSLYDTWTLHSWSEWLTRQKAGRRHSPIILHVDDHRDLGPPRLFIGEGGWVDAITGAHCNFQEPASVRAAIESGAIGMGSFLTPLLHAVPNAEVRHLCQRPEAAATSDYLIQCTTQADTLLAPGRERPAVHLEPMARTSGPGTYRVTQSVKDWLGDLGEGPILLHVDMDYFNNRYDGDSDWLHRQGVLDPSLPQIFGKVDEMVGALIDAGLMGRLEDIVIAFSPGFFPAEFWHDVDARLAVRLGEQHG